MTERVMALLLLPETGYRVINFADDPTDDAAKQRPVKESDQAPGPGDCITDEVIAEELKVHSDALSAFDQQPDGHAEQPDPANQGADHRQHSGLNPDHDPAQFFIFALHSRHSFKSCPINRVAPWPPPSVWQDERKPQGASFCTTRTDTRAQRRRFPLRPLRSSRPSRLRRTRSGNGPTISGLDRPRGRL